MNEKVEKDGSKGWGRAEVISLWFRGGGGRKEGERVEGRKRRKIKYVSERMQGREDDLSSVSSSTPMPAERSPSVELLPL